MALRSSRIVQLWVHDYLDRCT